MADDEITTRQIGRRNWRSIFRFDTLLFVFLGVGWSLIFATATFGLRIPQGPWLEVGLVSKVSADYSVKAADSTRVAPVKPQVVEAVQQDQLLYATPTPLAPTVNPIPTFTQEPTLTPNSSGVLQVNAGGPYTGNEGSSIDITAELVESILNLVPGVVSYDWDLDNDSQYDDFNGATTSVTFYDEGDYTVAVQATDLLGQVSVAEALITVSNVPPLIELQPQGLAEEGQEVAFAAAATDPGHDLLMYEWDFGDSSPKVNNTLNPRHIYQNNGDYAVRLTVRDNDGGVAEETLVINVTNLPPLADAGPAKSLKEGERVTFEGTATDPGALDTLSYAWDFSYDGRTFTTEASGPTASKIYPNGPLKVVAALRVRDEDGGEAIDTVNVTVGNVPPVITGISNDGPVGEGSPLALTVTATDAGNDPLIFAVDWDNDGAFDEAGPNNTASNIWNNQGDYTVRIRVDDGDGGEAFATTQVSAFNEPPVAVASADSEVLEGSVASFDASDSSDPGADVLTYAWDFGDGQNGSGESASHVYDDNGVYSATLTVTDDSGAFSSAGVAVTVLNVIPTVEAGPDVMVDEGTSVPVAYNGIATDPGAGDTLIYTWDFGDGSTVQGPAGTYSFAALDGPSERMVGLQVTDDDGGTASDSFKLTVRNLSPQNVEGGSYTCDENDVIQLTATANDVPADLPGLEYAWDLDNNPDYEASGRQVSYTCTRQGNQIIRLRVRDKDYNNNEDDAHDGESFGTAQVEVRNVPPIAVAAAAPLTTTVTVPIVFDAAGSRDPSPGPDTLTYRWNFGDGIVTTTTNITVTHNYTDDGSYTVSLRVFDANNAFDDTTLTIWITNQAPAPTIDSVTPPTDNENSPITFRGEANDPDDTSGLTYFWDFGDGNNTSGTDLDQVQYTYPEPGPYQVSLTVTDDNGASASSNPAAVTINNLAPTAVVNGPGQVDEGGTVTFDGNGSSDPGGGQLDYAWDLDNDGQFDDGTAATANFNPAEPGTNLTVRLQVSDNQDLTDVETIQINVNNLPPIADAAPDTQTISEGGAATFNSSGSNDPGGGSLTYEWDFNYDGSNFNVNSTDPNPSTTYPNGPATRTVALRVTDSAGAVSAVDTVQVIIDNAAPTARITANLTTVLVGEVVTFDGSGSSDPGNDPLSFSWDFADGVTDNSGPNVNHAWTNVGNYTIILQVDDGQGGVDTDTVDIQVN
ncbi:MAG: PKD domain-containing protein [Anaerolineales bacterium]|nr:PKD domain-containing protein [Anaerolineales bacterium]